MRRGKFASAKAPIFKACVEAIKILKGKIVHSDLRRGVIKAELAGSFLSYGHDIRVTIRQAIDGSHSVAVVSKSIGVQIISWGTNEKKEEAILRKIKSLLK